MSNPLEGQVGTLEDIGRQLQDHDRLFPYCNRSHYHTARKAYLYGFNDAIDAFMSEQSSERERHLISFFDHEIYSFVYLRGGEMQDVASYLMGAPQPTFEPWRIIRARILARDNDICYYCGEHATHVDHKTPVSRGGSYQDHNLVAACEACNRRKNTKTEDEFFNDEFFNGDIP